MCPKRTVKPSHQYTSTSIEGKMFKRGTTTRMRRWVSKEILAFAALLYTILTCHCTHAITYQHDELLYTKQLWNEFKLKFPHSALKPDDLTRKTGQINLDDVFVEHSLAAQRVAYHEDHQGFPHMLTKKSRVDTLLLDDDIPISGAVSASQEAACSLLLDQLWKELVEYTISKGKVRYLSGEDAHAVHGFVDQLCETNIPVALLRKQILIALRVANKGSRGQKGIEGIEYFYTLLPRHEQHAKPAEIAAVREACKSILKPIEDEDPDLRSMMDADNVSMVAIELQNQLADAVHDVVGEQDDNPTHEETLVSNALNLELQSRQSCLDRHPQCELWAAKGECTVNTIYMVGNGSPSDTGWCRRACGKCSPPGKHALHDVWPFLSASDIAKINDTSRQLLNQFDHRICTVDMGREYESERALLRDVFSIDTDTVEADRSSMPLIVQQATGIAGPVVVSQAVPGKGTAATATATTGGAGAGAGETSNLDSRQLQRSIVVTMRSISESIAEARPTSENYIEQHPPEGVNDIQRLLDKELGGKCLYTVGSWWSYEVCYRATVTQFHLSTTPSGVNKPDWIISLGVFKAADWVVREANDAALYASGTVVPFVAHEAVDGGDCTVTGEAGVDSLSDPSSSSVSAPVPGMDGGTTLQGGPLGETVLRSTYIRYMCSPDTLDHIVVKESIQCRYTVDVYLSSLCDVPLMTVGRERAEESGHAHAVEENLQEVEDAPVAIIVHLDNDGIEMDARDGEEENDLTHDEL